ncbi:hypothetical protein C8Q77DRAFT_1066591 [Trametes polyzona]|nr:hypothetical protein C8Q77DRAFT_1066591 [Trametes polyzona]
MSPAVPPSASPDILTYRYNGSMVYVPPAATYEEGVQYALQVFPELAPIEPSRIVISISGLVNQKRQLIRISPMAWKTVVFSRARYEVLDITIELGRPKIVISGVDGGEPEPATDFLPCYEDVKAQNPDGDFLSPSRAPSPPRETYTHKMAGVPGASLRPRSRSPSPSPSNAPCDADSSYSHLDWARGWFGKRVRS